MPVFLHVVAAGCAVALAVVFAASALAKMRRPHRRSTSRPVASTDRWTRDTMGRPPDG